MIIAYKIMLNKLVADFDPATLRRSLDFTLPHCNISKWLMLCTSQSFSADVSHVVKSIYTSGHKFTNKEIFNINVLGPAVMNRVACHRDANFIVTKKGL